MNWRPAPAAKALLDQADRRSPNRNDDSDGLLGDPAHAARASKHNPDSRGVVLAVDLTHDPLHGIDAHLLVHDAVARRDPRVLEAISRGRIWTKARADEGWRPYKGANRHDKHAHISIDRAYEDDTSPWWPTHKPAKATTTPQEDDMPRIALMTDTKRAKNYKVNLDNETYEEIDASVSRLWQSTGLKVLSGQADVDRVLTSFKEQK